MDIRFALVRCPPPVTSSVFQRAWLWSAVGSEHVFENPIQSIFIFPHLKGRLPKMFVLKASGPEVSLLLYSTERWIPRLSSGLKSRKLIHLHPPNIRCHLYTCPCTFFHTLWESLSFVFYFFSFYRLMRLGRFNGDWQKPASKLGNDLARACCY